MDRGRAATQVDEINRKKAHHRWLRIAKDIACKPHHIIEAKQQKPMDSASRIATRWFVVSCGSYREITSTSLSTLSAAQSRS
jgi:hypothetical protein